MIKTFVVTVRAAEESKDVLVEWDVEDEYITREMIEGISADALDQYFDGAGGNADCLIHEV